MTYLSTVLADAPIHYWRLADPGGLFAHDIGSVPKHALASPNGLFPQLGYSGPNSDGGCALFGASGGYLTVDTVSYTPPFTLECMVYLLQLGNGPYMMGYDTSPDYVFGILSGTNKMEAWGPTAATGAGTALTTYVWNHLAVTFSGGNAAFFLNGVADGGGAVGAGVLNLAMFIGRHVGAGNGMVGFLSECAMYATALTGAKLLAHFNALDNRASAPVYQQAGAFNSATGRGDPLSSVLPYVSKTYQSSP